jgi:hypothetical protein
VIAPDRPLIGVRMSPWPRVPVVGGGGEGIADVNVGPSGAEMDSVAGRRRRWRRARGRLRLLDG